MEFSLPALPQGYGKSALLWHDLVHKDLCGLGILLNVMHTHDRLIDFLMEIRQDNFQVAKLLGALEKHMPYRLGDTAYGIAGTCVCRHSGIKGMPARSCKVIDTSLHSSPPSTKKGARLLHGLSGWRRGMMTLTDTGDGLSPEGPVPVPASLPLGPHHLPDSET